MEKRVGVAVATAVVLHTALLALTVLPRRSEASRAPASVDATTVELDMAMFTTDDGAASRDPTTTTAEPSGSKAEPRAGAAPHRLPSQPSALATDTELEQAGTPAAEAALTELGPGAEPDSVVDGTADANGQARQRVDLGLDGSVLRQATLAGRDRAPRAPRRRQVFSLGHWSENTVRSLAQKAAPWEGRALLTLEWDSTGQLLSVTSSGASSHGEQWQRLAKDLGSQLAARPNGGPQGKGLRVVYLVKSELDVPASKRSLLPNAKYASAEQLRENNLPPATAINLGVKADGSAATARIVSVELVRSDTL